MKAIEVKNISIPEYVKQLPVTNDSRPLAGAAWLETPVNLDALGYKEEEYIIKGKANIYSWPCDEEKPVVLRDDGEYCTRFLIRMPKDPEKFSGFVAVESFNGSFEIDHCSGGWGLNHEQIVKSGDAWVGYTKDYICVQSLLKFDPERYEEVGYPNPRPREECGAPGWDPFLEYCNKNNTKFPLILDPAYERGLTYEAAFQLAALLKSKNPSNPLKDYNVKYVVGFGINDYNTYVAALHPYMRLEGDKPVFDGYLMYMSGHGGALNNEEDMFPLASERCRRTCDVPVIKVQTAGDLRGFLPHPLWAALWRCEDSDEPGKQMRWYEIPGLGVAAAFRQDESAFACEADYTKIGSRSKSKDNHYDYWNQMCLHIMAGAYQNLKLWISDGVLPPKAGKIDLIGEYPNFNFSLDKYGNHVGGIRHTYLEVPIAVFDDFSNIKFFDKKLRDSLYSSKEDYVEKVRADAMRMAKERWILTEAIDMLVEQAESLEW
mgnify:CR=1 FL=1